MMIEKHMPLELPPPPGRHHTHSYEEFVCGYFAAIVNIATTFPINKIMFRQMLHGIKTHHAIGELKREGLRYLYRGCLPPLCQKTATVSLMFGTYSKYTEIINENVSFFPKSITLVTVAMLAGTTEAILTPLERVQMLLQDKKFHCKFRNTFHVFAELRQFGIKEYYRGLTAILLRNGPSNALFFGLRDVAKSYLPQTDLVLGHFVEDFITGSTVGAFTSTICYPINVVKTKMQGCYGTPYMSFIETLKLVYNERDRSIRKLFYGVHVNYTRAFLSWGIVNSSYELLKQLLFPEKES